MDHHVEPWCTGVDTGPLCTLCNRRSLQIGIDDGRCRDDPPVLFGNPARMSDALFVRAADGAADADASPFTLCADTLIQCLAHLDAHALARVASVSRMWRDAAKDDGLWADLVRARWMLQDRKGRYKYGERTWREVFRVFYRRHRPPAIAGVSQRETPYAVGQRGRVGCWLYVTHQPACRLITRCTAGGREHRVLVVRVVVQNFREGPLLLPADPSMCLMLTLRDGSVSKPLSLGMGVHEPTTLRPLESTILGDVAFPMPPTMAFEPDVLEAAHRLQLRVCVPFGPLGGYVADKPFVHHPSVPLDVQCAFVPEAEMWNHYEAINRDFLVHHDTREDSGI